MSARNTAQRTLVREYLRATTTHPSARDVYRQLKGRLPGLSLSTVYRTLSWLRENGEAVELRGRDGVVRFDGDVSSHAHFWCSSCGDLWDLDIEVPEVRSPDLKKLMGFQVSGQRLELFGLCSRCLKKEDK